MAVLLENPVRSYAWGSPTVIPALLGQEPTGEPQAELWVGAHPGSPSTVAGDGRTLDRYIADDPETTLGAGVAERFGGVLPYLLKILAIERPLSIQVHPTIEQAQQGYAADDAAGIPLDSPKRSYRDRNHKPEMVVALTDFEALMGFREPRELVWLFEEIAPDEFADAIAMLKRHDGLRDLVTAWLNLPETEAGRLVRVLTEIAAARQDREALRIVARLADVYPGDRGILLASLMIRVPLRPGDAAFVGAGVPHAYLSGVAVEPQASSDNTLRAGLTPKHVDTTEVERILRYEPHGGQRILPRECGPQEHVYPIMDLDEFRICRLELSGEEIRPSGYGPRVVLVVDGEAELRTGANIVHSGQAEPMRLEQGRAAFIPSSEPSAVITGRGTAFTVTPALP
ncbi:mannose-6-phosphate isomerase, class I [Phytoactinopolyspora halotolerans]|uniref:mannose-6-phosphate isomerase n=1 Tax=Phytoactinopolyspora halotolerans TaxID=1981512 RepID=A0A6L9SDA4_9ACTN|nr:mannose-6-phosphate isomerase, class I [Phytoactinopolyspora halotolerans]NEE02481.1 mannose-6-phosphate isomerase, class I [Phytoactinopolyspora halotolerans]